MAITASFITGPIPVSRLIIDSDLNLQAYNISGTYYKVVCQQVDPPVI
jgi:hypothetical protein